MTNHNFKSKNKSKNIFRPSKYQNFRLRYIVLYVQCYCGCFCAKSKHIIIIIMHYYIALFNVSMVCADVNKK